MASGGLAPLLLVPAPGTLGPPVSGTHQQGEVYVDANGAFFICTTPGTPGTWRQLVAAAPAYSDERGVGGQLGSAGSLNLLAAPIRVFDTTVSDPPADKARPAGPLASGSVTAISLTGYKVTGIEVPPGAVGVIGNLTALNPSGAGALTLYGVGGKVAVPPSLSYKASTTASTLCMIGLSSSGKLDIKVATSVTDCTFDTVGFIY